MFNRAAVVCPHGAGFANLVFCAPGTGVVEIGYDSTEVLSMDEMYYQLSIGLHLRYWLVLGVGGYNTNITVNLSEVMSAVRLSLG